MPALNHKWTPSFHEGLLADGTERKVFGRLAPDAEEGACRCGRRRPVGVLLGWQSGARPRLDGQWFCRRNCLQSALQERLRREFPEGGSALSRVRHRVPLGLMLQMRGVVTARDLQEALHVQAATGFRLGDVLQTHFGVDEQRITAAIAAQWGLPVLHSLPPSITSLQEIAPARLFQSAGIFPVEITANRLLLACAEGPDAALALALERMYPVRVDFGVVGSSALEAWRKTHAESAVPVTRVRCTGRDMAALEAAGQLFRLEPVDSRIVRVNGLWWLRLWLEEAARRQEPGAGGSDTMDVLYSIEAESTSQRSDA